VGAGAVRSIPVAGIGAELQALRSNRVVFHCAWEFCHFGSTQHAPIQVVKTHQKAQLD